MVFSVKKLNYNTRTHKVKVWKGNKSELKDKGSETYYSKREVP
jgi:hypothetical protein